LGTFWAKLVPFAVWMWITNLVSNLFDVVDRYMIVHHGGMTAGEALVQVGNYHTSRMVPLLFVGVAGLLSSVITPHLAHDWELGRRRSVVRRLNLTLKTLALVLLAASTAVLFCAPWLFGVAFQNKFPGGLDVLPCTLAYCAWFGTFAVALNYLWCAERPALASLPLVVGLPLNVGLNLLLLPRYGLPGAVWATTLANLAALALAYGFSRASGMRVDLGTWVFSLAIAALCFGPWAAAGALVSVIALALAGDRLLTRREKRQLAAALAHGIDKLRALRAPNLLHHH
jgi:O-antigen/teichoic acid export membrane protein